MAAVNCLEPKIFLNIFFCAQQQKETRTDLEQHEGRVNNERIVIFG